MQANIHTRAAALQATSDAGARGELASSTAVVAGVLHDLNNLFQAALALVSMARANAGARHPADAKLLRVEECTIRASALTSKLQAYLSQSSTAQPIVVDTNALARDVWRALEAIHGPAIAFRLFTQPQPLWVRLRVSDCFAAAVHCAGALLGSAQGDAERRLGLDISVDVSPLRQQALLEFRLRALCVQSRLSDALEGVRDILAASGGTIEVTEVSGAGRAHVVSLWIPLLQSGSSEAAVTTSVPSDGVVGEALVDMLRDLSQVVARISRGAAPSSEPTEAPDDNASPLR